MSVSQPLLTELSQSEKSPVHAVIRHVPAVQAPVALAGAQVARQVPQLARSVLRLISQPSVAMPLQSPKPGLHDRIEHTPRVQLPRPLLTAHARPHTPQLEVSAPRLTSHPLSATPSQSANPSLHVNPHAPSEHVVRALGRVGQAIPQAPQWVGLVSTLVSQPLLAIASQLPKPAEQVAIEHAPAEHRPVALSYTQRVPHAPQLLTSVCKLTSQPLVTARSQSP